MLKFFDSDDGTPSSGMDYEVVVEVTPEVKWTASYKGLKVGSVQVDISLTPC